MECTQCGGPMMPETVIALRRSFIGFRETRSRGAYCPSCRIGVPMEGHQSAFQRPSSITACSFDSIRALLPVWRHATGSRSNVNHRAAMPVGNPVFLPTRAGFRSGG
jgi:hypothetical protein